MNVMNEHQFEHLRHKPLSDLERPRELVLLIAPLRSNVNLSRIVRLATCAGIPRIVACGNPKLDPKIVRDGLDAISFECRRSLEPVLKEYADDGYQLVGLEQTSNSTSLHQFQFERRTGLVIGNERTGLVPSVLKHLDAVVEIPVWGKPYSYNVATATTMAVYEYCRQFPRG